MFKTLLPWKLKHNKTKVMAAGTTMEQEVLLQHQNLLPCQTCGRTFLPTPLKKHEKVCLKSHQKRRRPFNSLKQRVEGTDLAAFHINHVLKPVTFQPPQEVKKVTQSKWKEKHLELVNTIRAARGCNPDMSSSPKKSTSSLMAGNERCPSCDRQFGPKAFDRHVEWCKEHKARIHKSPMNQVAKERLEARTKYRVPPLTKSKRSLTREKYSSPNVAYDKEPATPTESIKSCSSVSLSRSPSIRKPNSIAAMKKKPDKEKIEPIREKLKLDVSLEKNSPFSTASPSPKVAPSRSKDKKFNVNAMGDCDYISNDFEVPSNVFMNSNYISWLQKSKSAPVITHSCVGDMASNSKQYSESPLNVTPRLMGIIKDVFTIEDKKVVLTMQQCRKLMGIDKKQFPKIVSQIKDEIQKCCNLTDKNFENTSNLLEDQETKKLLSCRFNNNINKNNIAKADIVKTNLGDSYMTYPMLVDESAISNSYDPFETAQRQFLELLDGDDLTTPYKATSNPLQHTPRPTTQESSHKDTKPLGKLSSAGQNKRTSVIDPPCNFQDSLESVNDDFELLENLINDHFKDDKLTMTSSFFLHDSKNNNKLDNDIMTLSSILSTRKYSDDMSSIDPSLINENDNLSIPDHFKVDDLSPTSTIDTDITIRNEDFIDNYKKVQKNTNDIKTTKTNIIKSTSKAVKTEKPVIKRSISLINRSDSIRSKVKDKATSASAIKTTNKPLTSKNKLTSKSNSSVNLGKGDAPEKKKGLPSLKKSMTLFEASPKPSMRNRDDVNNYFSEIEQKNSFQSNFEKEEQGLDELLKPEDLFAVDDKMFEEYKKYEEMYLREKEQQNKGNNKKHKPKLENFGIHTASEDEQINTQINKISNDSAYGSLQRKTSKSRSRGAKLSPLEQNHLDSTSSSGSENCPNSPAVTSTDIGKQKLPKFCHECGNKYPLTTAKFCVECGVRRLVL